LTLKQHICKIIPDDILEKLGDKVDEETFLPDADLSKFLRENRQFLLANPELKKPRRKVSHKEIRNLYDSKNQYEFTATPIATDEQIHSSKESKYPALQLANKTYDFFHNRFDLESFDNNNAPIDVHINFGQKYNNAFWDGKRMVFGNGDGTYFNTFLTQNVFTHELAHAVTEYQCGLKYENQSGALNEHLSDVFAVCIDQQILKQKPTVASWLIGEGVFNTTKLPGAKALRSFKNELAYNDKLIGKDPQPKHMSNFKNLPNTNDGDWGGVHINSGIPNRAFYEFCVLAETEVSDERTNYSWKAPVEIWFATYPRIKPINTFKEFALDTISVTKRIHPQLEKQIRKAWNIVGVI
jgi:Zn-dependent metalloprotease